MDSTSTAGSSVESTPQRTTPQSDLDGRSVNSHQTLGGSVQTNQNRVTGNKAVHGSSSKKETVGSVTLSIPRTKYKISKSERRLYFSDLTDEDRRFDRTSSDWHELLTAPIFTSSVLQHVNMLQGPASGHSNSPFVSYAGIGRVVQQYTPEFRSYPTENIVYMNTNAPSSTMICGVQGSGKSHSVSIIIENSLIQMQELGKLPEKLSVVVFHLGASQTGMHLPCESAFIRASKPGHQNFKIPVTVLVSPSNLLNMRKSYQATGAKVVPFYLSTKDLNCTRMLSLMHVEEGNKTPLYMEVIQQILRSMGNKSFDYETFRRTVKEKQQAEFTREQNMPLELRIQLLEAMLLECQTGKVESAGSITTHFKRGEVTIVDLTDPFINSSAASALFDMALSLYLETKISSGKLLVLDEAHKYLTSQASTPFVNSVFSVIRQQRHLGIRTVISTQEPTAMPENMIGLCSTIICHRFSSPFWWAHLKRLVALDDTSTQLDLFDCISRLRTGEGVVFCPLALCVASSEDGKEKIQRYGRGCLIVKIRPKLTSITGESVLSHKV